jgi:uracil DNA glycosylase
MERIKKNLKVSQDRKKIYPDKNKVFRYFKVGEHLFLKVKVKRSSLILGSDPMLQKIFWTL